MPKFVSITCEFKGGKQVFLSGEDVEGEWIVVIGAPVKVDKIITYLYGASFVKWTEVELGSTRDRKFATHELYTKQLTFHHNGPQPLELQPGTYKYPFKYFIPNDQMHSSFEGKYGATLWYTKIKLSRSLPYPDVEYYRCFTYLSKVDIDKPLYAKTRSEETTQSVSKALGIGNAGDIKLSASIDRRGFCPGEFVQLSVKVDNKTTKNLGKLEAKLMQVVEYKANEDEKTTEICLRRIVGKNIDQGDSRRWDKQRVMIDLVPPTTLLRTSYCIDISYHIKVIVPLPFYNGKDVTLTLPITIGTVPQGHISKKWIKSSDNSVTDLTNCITYARMNKGTGYFGEGSSLYSFPVTSYTPYTVYVSVYKPNTAIQGANAKLTTNQNQQAKTQVARATAVTQTMTRVTTKPTSKTTSPGATAMIPTQIAATHNPQYPVQNSEKLRPEKTCQASAPPLEVENKAVFKENPPSYEEAIGINAQNDVVEEVDDLDEPDVYMLVRFPTNDLQEYKKSLTDVALSLRKFKGEVLTIPEKVQRSTNSWPDGMVVSILKFRTKKDARGWFAQIKDKFLRTAGVVLVDSKDPYQKDKMVTTFNITKKHQNSDSSSQARLTEMRQRFIIPGRITNGGLLTVATNKIELLSGDWGITEGMSLSSIAWPDVSSMPNYARFFPDGMYEEYLELVKTLYETVASCVVKLQKIEEDNPLTVDE